MSEVAKVLRLLSLSNMLDDGFRDRVIRPFADELTQLLRQDKVQYVSQVIETHYMSRAEISKFLGYKSQSGLNQLLKAENIPDEKFIVILTTLGRDVPHIRFPSNEERRPLALMKTVCYVRRHELDDEFSTPLSREEFECLERFFSPHWRLALLNGDDDEQIAIARRLLTDIHHMETVNARNVNSLSDIERVFLHWGKAYTLTIDALPGVARDHE